MSVVVTARELGLLRCHACGAIYRLPSQDDCCHCRRCGVRLHLRKYNALTRAWALLIAAAMLYLPANLIPIMKTSTLLEQRSDTILSGVVALWQQGSPEIAVIVFVASIVVPLAKIAVLALLLVTAQRRSAWRQAERARLYRFIEFIGYWSMLDVFVVALLVGLVHFRGLAEVQPGGGAVAFAAVVVLTMLASKSFDPRLIWDSEPSRQGRQPS
ncbi:paraquat-inducible protein A [Sinimarinibacterium thermocellulolyticum]|uniref:Paraquat-inducible protein A n=1 Tax=Sinimarinibacterium thermocellulolyticum TaxID=3170016 RepID=A0ABV2A957_9GAMM